MSIKIKKGKYESDFTTVPNETFQRNDISWKAKGLLIYLLTLPDDWEIYKKDLSKRSSDGYSLTNSAFRELQDLGYIVEDGEKRNEGMFSGKDYLVFPVPKTPTDGENQQRSPIAKINNGTDGENQHLHNKHSITPYSRNTTKETYGRKRSKKKSFVPPTMEEVKAFFKEKKLNEDYAKIAYEHYETNDWNDTSNKPVLNWKQKMLTNWINGKDTSKYRLEEEDLFSGQQPNKKPQMIY